MKKIVFIAAILIAGVLKATAQPPEVNQISMNVATTDMQVVFYVSDLASPCTIVGISNPVTIPAGNLNTMWNYFNLTWALDPQPNGILYNWEFTHADVYNCVGVNSAGGACPMNNYDFASCNVPHCGPITHRNCFEYSLGSGGCGGVPGVITEIAMHPGPTATLEVIQ